MLSKIKAGYCDIGVAQFKGGQWFINSAPVAQQLKLDQYPCYALEHSELGSYVCVIGDTQYNYSNPTIRASSGMSYTYQDTNPEVLSSIWLLEHMDAFYLAVRGTFADKEVTSVIPVAFNAYDMELYLKELHLYIDIEETTVLGTIVLFDTTVQSTHTHFYLNRADCESVCSMCINTVISKGLLTSLMPNITGFDASTNTEFVEEMGVVDIHLLDKQPSVAAIQQACTQACDGLLAQGKRVTPNGYLPKFDTAPCTAEPTIIPSNIENWSSLLVVTSPDDESLAFELSDYMESLESDYDEDEYDLLLERHHILIALIATSQICGFTAQDYSIGYFKRWLASDEYISVLRDCLKHDYLFPDAIAFYAESGLLLHGEDYTKIEAIISGEYALAVYDKVAEACGSSFSLEYAKMMQTRKSCFKEGKSNRATLPSKVPFAEWGFSRDVALLYFAYMGMSEHTYLPAVDKYVLWDYLCTGPYLNPILMSCAVQKRVSMADADSTNVNFKRADLFMSRLHEKQGKKTQFNFASWETIDLSATDMAKLQNFETTYMYTAIRSDRSTRDVRLTTYMQWWLLNCNMVILADAVPRGLGNTEISVTNFTIRAVTHMIHVWLRAILGTIEECSDPVCKYAPFAALTWRQIGAEWMLEGTMTRDRYLPYGWVYTDDDTHYMNSTFVMRDARGRNRVFKGFEVIEFSSGEKDQYSSVKNATRRALARSNRGEAVVSGKSYTNVGLFPEASWCFIPACYELSQSSDLENEASPDISRGGSTVLADELFEVSYISYTLSILEYVQRTVNALLALSDRSVSNSFFNQYVETLKLFNNFFKPIFSTPNEAQFRSKLLLTTCYIQDVIPEYTLSNLAAVLKETNVDTAWDIMLKKMSPGGVPDVADICKPPEAPILTGASRKMTEDLESLLKSLETISLEEEIPDIVEEQEHPALQFLTRDSSGLFELQPRSALLQRMEDAKADTPAETSGLDALEQELDANKSSDNLFNALDDFLGSGGLADLESGDTISSGLGALEDELSGGLASLENALDSDEAVAEPDDTAQLSDTEKDLLNRLSGEPAVEDEPDVDTEESSANESEQAEGIEYLYNSASPDSTAILIQQIGTRHPTLAFKLLAVISLDDSVPSMLIDPTIKAITDLCDQHKGYCYFDSEDALRLNISGVEYYILQVNNAERRAKNALSSGMLTYKYYGSVLPKILGSSILT